jgi:hypothetical protein
MKTKFLLTLLSAAAMIASASAAPPDSKGQTVSLPDLSAEVTALRASVVDLQSQVSVLPGLTADVAALRATVLDLQNQLAGNGNPYAGTYTVTTFEVGFHGCGIPSVGPGTAQYLPRQAGSSAMVTSSIFDATSNGSLLSVPDFQTFTQELRLSGIFEADGDPEEARVVPISPDGSMEADVGNAVFSGQFSDDGSMFTALVIGSETVGNPGCAGNEAWTVQVTGVRK